MPAGFQFPYSDVEMWLPLRPTDYPLRPEVIARTARGVSVAEVQSAMNIVAAQLERENPRERANLKIMVSRWRDNIGKSDESTLIFVLSAVGLVLLIACADVAGLLLSRAVKRQREIAIRASLGAGFWRVLRQLAADSLVLAAAGSAFGIAVAGTTLRILTRQITALPIAMPHVDRIAINGRVLLFNIAVCLALASIVSIAPVLLAARTDVQSLLRGGVAGGNPRGPSRLFALLIACEAAFAFLLLAGSGLMVRSLIRLQQADHGINPDHVLTLRVPIGTRSQPRPGKYDTRARQAAYYHEMLGRLRQVPGVAAVAVVNNLPLSSVRTSIFLKGPDGQPFNNSTRTISAQYFTAMGIPLIAGRPFTDADDAQAPPVAIINQTLARVLFPGRDPLGQPLPGVDETDHPAHIVGIARDTPQMSYERPPEGEVYIPYEQLIFGAFMSTIVVRTPADPLSLAADFRKEIRAVDGDQPIVRIATMNEVIAESIWRPRFSAWIFSILGALALVLTSAGVYGVVSYTTAMRVREVGIRVALGATPGAVMAAVFQSVMIPLTAGLAVSLAAALALSRLLAGLLYQIGPTDPVAYTGAAVLLLATGAMASARPAWKASSGDPMVALRSE
jgi:putative ABC transport system permease protein